MSEQHSTRPGAMSESAAAAATLRRMCERLEDLIRTREEAEEMWTLQQRYADNGRPWLAPDGPTVNTSPATSDAAESNAVEAGGSDDPEPAAGASARDELTEAEHAEFRAATARLRRAAATMAACGPECRRSGHVNMRPPPLPTSSADDYFMDDDDPGVMEAGGNENGYVSDNDSGSESGTSDEEGGGGMPLSAESQAVVEQVMLPVGAEQEEGGGCDMDEDTPRVSKHAKEKRGVRARAVGAWGQQRHCLVQQYIASHAIPDDARCACGKQAVVVCHTCNGQLLCCHHAD